MHPHNNVESLIRMLSRSLQYMKCTFWLSSAGFEHEIPSLYYVGLAALSHLNLVVDLGYSEQLSFPSLPHYIPVISVLHVTSTGSSATNIALLAPSNGITVTFAKGLACGFCQPPADHISNMGNYALHPTPSGTIVNISHATLDRFEYFLCVSSC